MTAREWLAKAISLAETLESTTDLDDWGRVTQLALLQLRIAEVQATVAQSETLAQATRDNKSMGGSLMEMLEKAGLTGTDGEPLA